MEIYLFSLKYVLPTHQQEQNVWNPLVVSFGLCAELTSGSNELAEIVSLAVIFIASDWSSDAPKKRKKFTKNIDGVSLYAISLDVDVISTRKIYSALFKLCLIFMWRNFFHVYSRTSI